MSDIGKPERVTQERVKALFNGLGYAFLGDWTERATNSNIEEKYLCEWLTQRGYTPAQINMAMQRLRTEATNHNPAPVSLAPVPSAPAPLACALHRHRLEKPCVTSVTKSRTSIP